MHLKKFEKFIATLSCLIVLSFGAVCAQQTASANLTGEVNDAVTEPVRRDEKSSDHGFSTTDFLPPGAKKSIREVDSNVPIRVTINVPHNKDAIREFTAYPYPVEPPLMKAQPKPLPDDPEKGLRGFVMNSGYTNRTQALQAYPYNGWRWQYAFQAALRKSGLGVPHIMSEMYTWTDEMLPYVVPECKRLNQAEKERLRRYRACSQDAQENHVDFESDAVRKGLFPTEVVIQRFNGRQVRFGNVKVAPGSWWIIGTHRVAGLKYYWNEPITVDEGQPNTVELNESNALLIEGGW
jgi:hypothetical protein